MTKILTNTALALLLGVGMSAVAQDDHSQSTQSGAKQEMHEAGRDTKDAGHLAARGTEKGTKKAYRATKRGMHKTAEGTGKAADKVRDKTE